MPGVEMIFKKDKVVPVRAKRRIGGTKVWLHSFLTSAVGEGEWLTLRMYNDSNFDLARD
jgi:hypothetical protein